MTEPKFQVGQSVAVCSSDLRIVIPSTVVTSRKFMDAAFCANVRGVLEDFPAGWYYTTAAYEEAWGHERVLRPIDPDTEYRDEEEREVSL